MLHMLTEHPYHVHLGEHVFGFSPQVTFKIGFPSGQLGFDRGYGGLAFADTDNIDPEEFAHTWSAVNYYQPHPARHDLVLAFANSMLRPLLGKLAPVAMEELHGEITARSKALSANAPGGTVQLSFSCVHSWIRAALLGAGSHGKPSAVNQTLESHYRRWLRPPVVLPVHTLHEDASCPQEYVGYCGVTSVTSDCERGDQGAWDFSQLGTADRDGCLNKCRQCTRCRWVSFSFANKDCSWYNSCSPGMLRTRFGGETYVTMKLK